MNDSPNKEKILSQALNTTKEKLNILKTAIKQERLINAKAKETEQALLLRIKSLEETITEKDKMLNKSYKEYQDIKEQLEIERTRNETLLKATGSDEDMPQVFKYISYKEAETIELEVKRLRGENEYLKAQLDAIRIKSHEQGEYIVKQKEELLTHKNTYNNKISEFETICSTLESKLQQYQSANSELKAENEQMNIKCEYNII